MYAFYYRNWSWIMALQERAESTTPGEETYVANWLATYSYIHAVIWMYIAMCNFYVKFK